LPVGDDEFAEGTLGCSADQQGHWNTVSGQFFPNRSEPNNGRNRPVRSR
jgi:hypothetical protein